MDHCRQQPARGEVYGGIARSGEIVGDEKNVHSIASLVHFACLLYAVNMQRVLAIVVAIVVALLVGYLAAATRNWVWCPHWLKDFVLDKKKR